MCSVRRVRKRQFFGRQHPPRVRGGGQHARPRRDGGPDRGVRTAPEGLNGASEGSREQPSRDSPRRDGGERDARRVAQDDVVNPRPLLARSLVVRCSASRGGSSNKEQESAAAPDNPCDASTGRGTGRALGRSLSRLHLVARLPIGTSALGRLPQYRLPAPAPMYFPRCPRHSSPAAPRPRRLTARHGQPPRRPWSSRRCAPSGGRWRVVRSTTCPVPGQPARAASEEGATLSTWRLYTIDGSRARTLSSAILAMSRMAWTSSSALSTPADVPGCSRGRVSARKHHETSSSESTGAPNRLVWLGPARLAGKAALWASRPLRRAAGG